MKKARARVELQLMNRWRTDAELREKQGRVVRRREREKEKKTEKDVKKNDSLSSLANVVERGNSLCPLPPSIFFTWPLPSHFFHRPHVPIGLGMR